MGGKEKGGNVVVAYAGNDVLGGGHGSCQTRINAIRNTFQNCRGGGNVVFAGPSRCGLNSMRFVVPGRVSARPFCRVVSRAVSFLVSPVLFAHPAYVASNCCSPARLVLVCFPSGRFGPGFHRAFIRVFVVFSPAPLWPGPSFFVSIIVPFVAPNHASCQSSNKIILYRQIAICDLGLDCDYVCFVVRCVFGVKSKPCWFDWLPLCIGCGYNWFVLSWWNNLPWGGFIAGFAVAAPTGFRDKNCESASFLFKNKWVYHCILGIVKF